MIMSTVPRAHDTDVPLFTLAVWHLSHDDACHVVRHVSRKAVLIEVAGSDVQDVTGWCATQRVERVLEVVQPPVSVVVREVSEDGAELVVVADARRVHCDSWSAECAGASLQYSVHHLASNCPGPSLLVPKEVREFR